MVIISQSPQVWSLVALIYNNWMIYLPTYAEQDEGLVKVPVMCSTTRWVGESQKYCGKNIKKKNRSNNCTWWSFKKFEKFEKFKKERN